MGTGQCRHAIKLGLGVAMHVNLFKGVRSCSLMMWRRRRPQRWGQALRRCWAIARTRRWTRCSRCCHTCSRRPGAPKPDCQFFCGIYGYTLNPCHVIVGFLARCAFAMQALAKSCAHSKQSSCLLAVSGSNLRCSRPTCQVHARRVQAGRSFNSCGPSTGRTAVPVLNSTL